jgi:hypothetical protein
MRRAKRGANTSEGHWFEPCCAHQEVFTFQPGPCSRSGLAPPRGSILAVASGGGEGPSYARELILGAYLVAVIAAATTILVRCDVIA